MTLRARGRRHALASAGAAALTAAAVFAGPAASAAPMDDAEQAVEAVQEEAQQAIDEAEQALDDAREQAEDAANEGEDEAQQAVEEAEEALEDTREQAEQAVEDAREQAEQAAEDAGDAAAEAREQAEDAFGDLPQVDAGDWLPDDLREDLEGLQDLPAGERTQRLQEIVQNAVGGDYGDEAERWSERLGGLIASLPQDLRRDIQGVFGQEPEEARADVRQIIEDAVDGEYGDDVEKWADWLRNTAQRWDLARSIQGVGSSDSGN
ncbi:hypothetical protein [Blastococcus tunisiensis]|uniref:Colicin import membrane protein n=1 Tax=Blastococcus tunisiensis TaxID=1798228 RepID=A0A1I2IZX6_9ACTN|nr:hypothetical protein [Blastococcus sp. DSM 46838]SFF46031.1 hypothetical protein SAMN05216574_11448 [Blastococcus sp. DSM 46838]